MLKIICLISSPRTGSNRLCEIVKSIPEVNGMYEIFHPENAWGIKAEEIEYINSITGSSFKIERHSNEPELIEFIRQNPSRFLELIVNFSEKAGYKYLFFKVFSEHMPLDQLMSLAVIHNINFVFLTRNTIDTYISLVKASSTDQYDRVNTTSLKPEISVNQFLDFQNNMIKWYTSCFLYDATRQTPIVIRYEDLYDSKTSDVDVIGEALASFGIEIPKNTKEFRHQRQDMTPDWRDKIANPEDLETLILQHRVITDISTMLNIK